MSSEQSVVSNQYSHGQYRWHSLLPGSRHTRGMLPGYHPQANIDAAADAIGASPIGAASKGLAATGEALTEEVANLPPTPTPTLTL